MYIQELYEKYCKENICEIDGDSFNFEEFEKEIEERLSQEKRITYAGAEQGKGVLYYDLWEEDGLQICDVPVFGYYASSEKILSEMFIELADEVMKKGSTLFQVHLYAHDVEAQRLFLMMQFGYMSEKGIYKIEDTGKAEDFKHLIKTLTKDEISQRWDEIWSLTHEIIKHLSRSPIFYPGEEFTEEVYQEFFLDTDTNLHVAFDENDKMIGIIETNQEAEGMLSEKVKSVNIGEAYVLPQYRGSGLSKELLLYASEYEKSKGAKYLWVEHGTANPNARGFWNKHFRTYQYELVRKIER